MPFADDDWRLNATINHISSELERTHLARSPQLLRELDNIKETCHELGQPESFRLKQYYNEDV
ncbi:uncharacterized protein LOC115762256 [Drosophila novamexicana]|uniref:Uncharacterized protein n=1 Tax=Drosophila virilis TaxID=7244 RepID=A0A0Q9WBL6_DROVI|nr:uncharacterized protein LOC26531830 [Drosophila virilis]XP_030560271.1 uncharacterized protein LOC115762256 [Drosophila novamexicana]KRF78543.1 uncharacterized protein Dvir_GJ27060 [Drosophila virilis]